MAEKNVWYECTQSNVENKEKETGITIHYVNEHYDEEVLFFRNQLF
jgi:phosphoribosylglycinamide formyltransferase-1